MWSVLGGIDRILLFMEENSKWVENDEIYAETDTPSDY